MTDPTVSPEPLTIPEEPQLPVVSPTSLPKGEPSQCSPASQSEPQIPPSITSHRSVTKQAELQGVRCFLDICSGSTRPLSSAILQLNCPVLSFDVLLDPAMNLLHDDAFEDLLHLCSSGQVGYGAASPSWRAYSRLKLRPGPGPKALRTPDHLGGIPGLSPDELQQVQESFIMLQRCITCLQLIFQSGGHTHLEQPTNAMSWLEPVTQHFLRQTSAFCVCIAACCVGLDIHKSWMFASSFEPITSLASTCHHPPGSHESIQGTRDEFGHF